MKASPSVYLWNDFFLSIRTSGGRTHTHTNYACHPINGLVFSTNKTKHRVRADPSRPTYNSEGKGSG